MKILAISDEEVPGFYEYLYLNDYDYSLLDEVIDNQMQAAIDYLKR